MSIAVTLALIGVALGLFAAFFVLSRDTWSTEHPSSAVQDVDLGVRVHLLGVYLFSTLILGPLYVGFFLWFGALWTALAPALFTVISAGLTWQYRRGRHREAATGLVAAICVLPALCMATSGALQSPLLIWLAPGAFMAGALVHRKATLVAGVAAILFLVAFALAPAGYPGVVEMQEPFARTLLYVLCGASAIGLLSYYGYAAASEYAAARSRVFAVEAALESHRDALLESNASMRRVLDSVHQGLIVADLSGKISGGWSAVVEDWFGRPEPGMPLWDLVARHSEVQAGVLSLCFEQLEEDFLPMEVVLDQFPRRMLVGEQLLELRWSPSEQGVLVVMTDVTLQEEQARTVTQQGQLIALFRQYRQDAQTVRCFLEEADALVRKLEVSAGESTPGLVRDLHTLKGGAASMGLGELARLCHEAEDVLESLGVLGALTLSRLVDAYGSLRSEIDDVMEDGTRVAIERGTLLCLAAELEQQHPASSAAATLRTLAWDPVRPLLTSLGDRAVKLGERLERAAIDVVVEDNDLHLPPGWNRGLFATLVHVVRNAVDHGIESAADRVASQKSEVARLLLRAKRSHGSIIIEISDDGRGIDWSKIAQAAATKGLTVNDQADLSALLFADGLSTRHEVSETSGRGVGMSAVLAAAKRCGGTVAVESRLGAGTTFRFVLPAPVEVAPVHQAGTQPQAATQREPVQ